MEQRKLGRTGHKSSVIIMGTAAFWSIDQQGANEALDLALASGINHIDVAPQYGNAEEVTGPWLAAYRDRFFLGCKTLERRRNPAMIELNRSLKRLNTDVFDLYQMHAVCTMEELDAAFSPGGVIETMVAARDQGKVRYLGLTGHGMLAPAVQLAALERFDFDTVMLPINPRLFADADYRRDAERLLAVCQQRDVGVMAIKSITKGPWADKEHTYNPWYEPYDTAQQIADSVRFALSLPVTGLPSAADVRLLPMLIEAAENFTPLSADEQETLIAARAGDALIFDGPQGVN